VTTFVLVGALLAVLALTVALYLRFGDPAYEAQVVTYTDVTDEQIVIKFRVRLPDGAGAVCAVRARSRDGAVVGRAEVPVPAGQTEITYRLATTARPFIGEVTRCRAPG
jgi:hypothetical protein